MHKSRFVEYVLNILVAASAILLIAVHIQAAIWDEGHPVWRPKGHGVVLVAYVCVLAMVFCAITLVARRGRSRLSMLVLFLVAADIVLLMT